MSGPGGRVAALADELRARRLKLRSSVEVRDPQLRGVSRAKTPSVRQLLGSSRGFAAGAIFVAVARSRRVANRSAGRRSSGLESPSAITYRWVRWVRDSEPAAFASFFRCFSSRWTFQSSSSA
jgi:hypothetical protein